MNNATLWYEKSAIAGNPQAMRALGTINSKGQDRPVDISKAIYWYRLAIDHGDTQSMYLLGRMYYAGEIIEKDHTEALKWFTQGAEKGEQQCYFQLGYMYYMGEGVEQDTQKAIEWYTKAADAGNPEAMHNLGVLLSPQGPNRAIPLLKPITKKGGTLLAIILIIWGVFQFTAAGGALLSITGCAAKKPTTHPVLVPDSSAPTIKEVKAATTQISTRLGDTANSLDKSTQTLKTSTEQIENNAGKGKAATPPNLKSLLDYWDKILIQVGVLRGVEGANIRILQQLTDQQQRVGDLSQSLDNALSSQKTREDFWVAQDAKYKAELANKDKSIEALEKDKQNAVRSKLIWLIPLCISVIGGSIVVGFLVNPKIGKACAVAAGVTLGIVIIIAETIWIVKYIAIGFVILMFAFIIWQAYVHRKALQSLVQIKEMQDQLLSPKDRAFMFGQGAFKGAITDEMKPALGYIKHFKKYVRNAIATPIPPEFIAVPDFTLPAEDTELPLNS